MDMTETERRKQWFDARAALNLGGDYPDWPDRLALPVIARLHDPASPVGMLGFLEAEADAGRLPTETIELQMPSPVRRVMRSSYLTRSTDRSPVTGLVEPVTTVARRVRTASVVDVACVVKDITASSFLAAWVAPYQREAETAAPEKPKKETQADRVEACLAECERRAAEQGKDFDCSNMPGQKAQFFDLLRRFDVAFKTLKDVTLSGYVKSARCKWSVGANANPDATDLYRELFPDAYRDKAGVIPLVRRKA